jgi:hypothetical protein
MEDQMNARAASASPFEIDVAPALRLYIDGLESWKASYERLAQTGAVHADTSPPDADQPATRTGGAAERQAFGPMLWQGMALRQAELSRFYAGRIERYLELSEKIARCRTPAELGEVQLDFLSRTFADYAQQSARVVQAVSEAASAPAMRVSGAN